MYCVGFPLTGWANKARIGGTEELLTAGTSKRKTFFSIALPLLSPETAKKTTTQKKIMNAECGMRNFEYKIGNSD
jgi:hypothetical protein